MLTPNDRSAWLFGPDTLCRSKPVETGRQPVRLVLLGAPGAGKSTLAESLQDVFGACPLSIGDIFRQATAFPASMHTPALRAATEVIQRGESVPDDLVLELVRERSGCLRCRGGFVLDGFPRTLAQAEALDDLLRSQNVSLDAVVCLEVPDPVLIERLSGRRDCPVCKGVYHLASRPPRHEGMCNLCHVGLIQRDDDQPAAIQVRVEIYETNIAPIIASYRRKGLLVAIPADCTPETTLQRTLHALSTRTARFD